MSVTGTDIAAYIGAAAWIPPIAALFYSRFVRPAVEIVPEKQVELGFTSYGPILNIRLALSSARKDATVDTIWADVRHSSGDVHRLTWTGMKETFSEITDTAGNRQRVERDQPAIAIRLTTSILNEKFVRFQDLAFHEGARPKINTLAEHIAYLAGQSGATSQAVTASKQFFDITEYFKSSFWWKPGCYTIEFGVSGRDNPQLRADRFAFELMQHDVDAFRQNLDLIKVEVDNTLSTWLPEYTPQPVPWQWRNIALVKKE